jgi:hypothetical protein
VLCLTDHADFDSVAKTRLLADLFTSHGVRVTKSVFPKSEPSSASKSEPGLDTPDYRREIERLHASGSEIAYHSFSPRARQPTTDECRQLASTMSGLCATTWIDHGVANYQFAFKNQLADGTVLDEFLGAFGVRNFWSYVDVADNPLLLRRPRPGVFRTLRSRRGLLRYFHQLRPRRLAYFALHQLRNMRVHTVSHAWEYWRKANNQRPSLLAELRAARNLRDKALSIYGHQGIVPGLVPHDLWVFDTVLLNHLAIQLRPESLDALTEDSSIFIGHCYFAAQHAHALGNCFVGDRQAPRLDPEWVRTVEHLAVRQERGDLAVLSFADVRQSLSSFYNSRLLRHPQGWELRCSPSSMGKVVAGPAVTMQKYSCHDKGPVVRDSVGLFTHLKDKDVLVIDGASGSSG